MSELGTPHATTDGIFTADQWNAALRRSSREVQDLLQHWLYGGDAPSAGAGGVVGGLVVAKVAGQMQVTVGAGSAFFYDAALASPLSKFGLVQLPAAVTVNVAAAHATNPRIDVVSIAAPTGTDPAESVMVWGAASENRPTQRGMQPVITITAGTPADPPVAPATPAGGLKLAEVLVPATVATLDTATVTNSRVLSRGLVNRDGTADMPLRTLSGRTWARQVFGASAVTVTNTSPSDLAIGVDTSAGLPLLLDKVGTGAAVALAIIPIANDLRGLEVVGGGIEFAVTEAFGGTVALAAKLYRSVPDIGTTEVATYTIANTVDGGSHAMVLTEAVDAIGYLYIAITASITGTPDGLGKLKVFGGYATFREPLPTL